MGFTADALGPPGERRLRCERGRNHDCRYAAESAHPRARTAARSHRAHPTGGVGAAVALDRGTADLVTRIVSFFRDDLFVHAEEEERGLYREVAQLLGDSCATEPMIYDHAAIRQLTARLEDADVSDTSLLQELLLRDRR